MEKRVPSGIKLLIEQMRGLLELAKEEEFEHDFGALFASANEIKERNMPASNFLEHFKLLWRSLLFLLKQEYDFGCYVHPTTEVVYLNDPEATDYSSDEKKKHPYKDLAPEYLQRLPGHKVIKGTFESYGANRQGLVHQPFSFFEEFLSYIEEEFPFYDIKPQGRS